MKEAMTSTLKVGGLGAFALSPCSAERKLGKAAAKAAGTATAIVRRWATLTLTTTEAFIPGPTDADDDIALLLESSRYSVKVPAPMVKGAAAPLPVTVTVTAFGESKAVALAAFDTGKRSDDSRKVHAYGAVEFHRPNGARYTAHVKVSPLADKATWRVACIVAQ